VTGVNGLAAVAVLGRRRSGDDAERDLAAASGTYAAATVECARGVTVTGSALRRSDRHSVLLTPVCGGPQPRGERSHWPIRTDQGVLQEGSRHDAAEPRVSVHRARLAAIQPLQHAGQPVCRGRTLRWPDRATRPEGPRRPGADLQQGRVAGIRPPPGATVDGHTDWCWTWRSPPTGRGRPASDDGTVRIWNVSEPRFGCAAVVRLDHASRGRRRPGPPPRLRRPERVRRRACPRAVRARFRTL